MVFIDTAGLRETEDEIEKEGIRRSFESIESSDLILHVVDCSEPLVEADVNFANKYNNRRKIVVANKSDLPSQADFDKLGEWVHVSCETGSGIEELKHSIEKLFLLGGVDSSSDQLMINARHEAQLLRAKIAVEASLAAIGDEWSLEIVAMELRIAVQAIGEIVGKTSTDDLLDRIFSEFCLGK
jgi:tRNA modification GTPase